MLAGLRWWDSSPLSPANSTVTVVRWHVPSHMLHECTQRQLQSVLATAFCCFCPLKSEGLQNSKPVQLCLSGYGHSNIVPGITCPPAGAWHASSGLGLHHTKGFKLTEQKANFWLSQAKGLPGLQVWRHHNCGFVGFCNIQGHGSFSL